MGFTTIPAAYLPVGLGLGYRFVDSYINMLYKYANIYTHTHWWFVYCAHLDPRSLPARRAWTWLQVCPSLCTCIYLYYIINIYVVCIYLYHIKKYIKGSTPWSLLPSPPLTCSSGLNSATGVSLLLYKYRVYPSHAPSFVFLFLSCFAAVVWPSVPLVVHRTQLGTAYGLLTSLQNCGKSTTVSELNRCIGPPTGLAVNPVPLVVRLIIQVHLYACVHAPNAAGYGLQPADFASELRWIGIYVYIYIGIGFVFTPLTKKRRGWG